MVGLESGRGAGLENQPRGLDATRTRSQKRRVGDSPIICELCRRFGNIPFDFDEGHRVEIESEAVKREKSGEKHWWTALIEGDDVFQWRKQNKKEK